MSEVNEMAFATSSTVLPTSFARRSLGTGDRDGGCRRCAYRAASRRAAVKSCTTDAPVSTSTTAQPAATTSAPAYSTPASLAVFRDYFSAMSGTWNSDRTYHYVPERRRESSQTTFTVSRLSHPALETVLDSNGILSSTLSPAERTYCEGFRVGFLTKMESSATLVESATNLAFVPSNIDTGDMEVVTGNYYRDLGYEEKGPVAAKFVFDPAVMNLTMTTYYTRVVSVDEIHLINAEVRLRKIVNYKRPSKDDAPLSEVLLVGFGVEHKGEEKPLVEQYQ